MFGDNGEVSPPVPMINVSLSQERVMTVTCLSVSHVFVMGEERHRCVFVFETLSSDSMKSRKLK